MEKIRNYASSLGKWLVIAGLVLSTGVNLNTVSAQDKVELTIATWANEQEAKEFDEIIEEINANSDQYVINQMIIPQDYYTKIQTMIAGNQAPDLMWLAQEYIPAYATNGAVMDLTEMLEKQDVINMDDFFEGSLNTAIWNDQTVGLPWIGQPYVVYYNKTLFEEKGVELPSMDWTWDDFHATATELTGDGVYGFANTGALPSSVLVWGNNGDYISEDGMPQVNSPESVEALTKLYELTTDTAATMPYEEANSLGVEQGFISQNIGMMVGGANDDVEKKVEEAGGNFEVGMALMPAGPSEQVTFNWTASTLISSQTENPEVAFQALLDITEAMFSWKVPAPVQSKAETIAEINPYKEHALEVIVESMSISRGFNNLPEQNELANAQWQILDLPLISNNFGQGELNVQEVADQLQEEFERILGN